MSIDINMIRIIIGIAILAGAAISDIKTRKVSDNFWIVAGVLAFILLGYEIMTKENDISGSVYSYYQTAHLLILVAIGIPFFYAILPFGEEPEKDGEDGEDEELEEGTIKDYLMAFLPLAVPLIFIFIMVWITGFTDATIGLVSIYIMVVVAYLFFYTGLLHGGADAKAFMAVAVLVPFYPIIEGSFPLIEYPANMPLEMYSAAFPFVFLAFMSGAIINVLIAPIVNLPRNLVSGDRGIKMFFGYKMDVDEVLAKKTFVWPMEVMRDGELVTIIRKVREVDNIPKEVAALKAAGIQTIWVQQKYPFIVAILFGFIFSVIVGNFMMLIY